jgi:hypothetical protein
MSKLSSCFGVSPLAFLFRPHLVPGNPSKAGVAKLHSFQLYARITKCHSSASDIARPELTRDFLSSADRAEPCRLAARRNLLRSQNIILFLYFNYGLRWESMVRPRVHDPDRSSNVAVLNGLAKENKGCAGRSQR